MNTGAAPVDKERILLIEDDEDIAGFVELELRHEGYAVEVENDGRTGLKRAMEARWDAILLDIMLPGLSGLEICRRLRAESDVPIIMLTAKGSVPDRVAGLDYGADDYLVKPFAIEELLARLRRLMRRMGVPQIQVLTLADLELSPSAREVTRGGKPIHLTAREFQLLQYLLENHNRVLSREAITRHVWGYDFIGDTNVVDVYIRYLRQKVDEGFDVPLIQTVRGVGYVMRET